MQLNAQKFIILERVDSTNNYAMAMVQSNTVGSGDAVFAMEQTAGKGRRGKTWKSNIGENIVLSIITQMQWLSVRQQFHLSAAVSLGCLDFFSKFLESGVKIKWPNDIFIYDRKAGGILIENVLKGNLWQWSVIGIGLNINQQNFENQTLNAISLKNITGENYNVIEIAKELHLLILKRIEKLGSGAFEEFLTEYNENLYCRNQIIKLRKGNVAFETRLRGVSEFGEMITKDAYERRFEFDEVEWEFK
jgi:BirA family biotin operon repressor/biotin-[acetyl-CoA-carboxylase] ligase